MPKTVIKYLLMGLVMLSTCSLYATHNRAGEITYIQTDLLTITATITTWTKTSSEDVDRDSLEIFWGDGTSELIVRSNGNGEELPNDIKKNLYTKSHTYPGTGRYIISVFDPNRIGGILNVNFPNSVNVPFYIQTTLTLVNSQFQGFNSSPRLLQPPIDFGCVGQPFLHNPNAYDLDGDSLSYALITPFQDSALIVPGYVLPDRIEPGPDNILIMDDQTGTLRWMSPQRAGEYNIAIAIREWRKGILINTTIRDMQIFITDCDNQPPRIDEISDYCVIAGDKIEFQVSATDADTNQLVLLTALGGPFILSDSPATFSAPTDFSVDPVLGQFSWQTTCNHISNQYYTVVFKAEDNMLGNTGLSTLRVVRIKVVGPPPKEPSTRPKDNQIDISWISPYDCEQTDNDYFKGFTVYRKINPSGLVTDSCTPGLRQSRFEPIAFNIRLLSDNRYTYTDDDVQSGLTYCYRVVAEFGKSTDGGALYNLVESLPSPEVCTMLPRDHPVITHVDVKSTDPVNGQIMVRWLKPNATILDTQIHRGPYQFRLSRSKGLGNTDFEEIPQAMIVFGRFSDMVDSSYLDVNINTTDFTYNYRVEFYTGESATQVFNQSQSASSILLSIDPLDKRLQLRWQSDVPWYNFKYNIYRSENGVDFDSIGQSVLPNFLDKNLTNQKEYCYKIKASGSYFTAELPHIFINHSQITCQTPIDTTPPCIPNLIVSNICDDNPNGIDPDQIFNHLEWTNPNKICDDTDDAVAYLIYFIKEGDDAVQMIARIEDINTLALNHTPGKSLAGCYAIAAEDLNGNISPLSDFVCVQDCIEFELPNTFTPNNDGANDFFVPRISQFVEDIDIYIYDRWGNKVFESHNPNFKWDGTNLTGRPLPSSTYYYVYKIKKLDDTNSQSEGNGYIHLLKD